MANTPNKVEDTLKKISSYLSSFISEKPFITDCKEVKQLVKSPNSNKTLPTNKAEFQNRLITFEYGKWTILDVSPLQCAQYGWSYFNEDVVQCATCQTFLCTTLPSPGNRDNYLHAVDIFKKSLKLHHKVWCGWRDNPCSDEFLTPPKIISVHHWQYLTNTVNILYSLKLTLPYIKSNDLLAKMGLQASELQTLCKSNDTLEEDQITAALLTLCGWTQDKADFLRCTICFRRIGLWNFYSQRERQQYEEIESKRQKLIEARKKKEALRLKKIEDDKVKEEELRKKHEQEIAAAILRAELEDVQMNEAELLLDNLSEQSTDSDEDILYKNIGNANNEAEKEERNNEKAEPRNIVSNSGSSRELTKKLNCGEMSCLENAEICFSEGTDQEENVRKTIKHIDGHESPANEQTEDDMEEDLWGEALGFKKGESSDSNSSDIDTDDNKSEPDIGIASSVSQLSAIVNITEHNQSVDGMTNYFAETPDESCVGELMRETKSINTKKDHISTSEKCCQPDNDNSSTTTKPLRLFRKRVLSTEESVDIAEKRARVDKEDSVDVAEKRARIDKVDVTNKIACVDSVDVINKRDCVDNEEFVNIQEEKMSVYNEESVDIHEEGTCIDKEESQPAITDETVDEQLEEHPKYLFDPLEQHMYWCGWVKSISTEEGARPLPGYLLLPPQLKDFHPKFSQDLSTSKKYAKNIEGLRAVRSMLSNSIVEECYE